MNPLVYVRLLRPKSWVKNILVFSALVFSNQYRSISAVWDSLLVFAGFCFVASIGYLINDWTDRHRDRHHPKKSTRPFASGEAGILALLIMSLLMVAGVVLVLRFLPEEVWTDVMTVYSVYLLLMFFYSTGLKHVFGLELLIVAIGILLRAVAGAVGIAVPLTSWFLLTILFLSLMIVTGKRRHERFILRGGAPIHRPILKQYPIPMLDALLIISGSASLITYTLWTVNEGMAGMSDPFLLPASVLFVLWGMMRYLYLLYSGKGGAPEQLFVEDGPLFLSICLWLGYLFLLNNSLGWSAILNW